MSTTETISAIATPPGKGGVGIIRVSGPKALSIAKAITGLDLKPRYAHFSTFSADNDVIDEGLALYFPGPNSFTGEDVLELQGHGGPVVLDQLLQLTMKHGARVAEPGEFSKRAFLNNKLDLAQAEAIADLIDATSVQAAKGALRSLQGEFSKQVNRLVDLLTHLRTYVEATIDFVDEDIDFIAEGKIQEQLQSIQEQLITILKAASQGQLLQEGLTVVIAGKPNAGKSSLLNQLTGRDSAIVTDIEGTTRDVLREYIQIDGLPLHIIDTAGLRKTDDVVEQEGVRRAKQEITKADLLLYLRDDSVEADEAWQELKNDIENCPPIVIINNKIDRTGKQTHLIQGEVDQWYLSAKQPESIELLKQYLKDFIGYSAATESQFTARRRHVEAIHQAQVAIDNALLQLSQRVTPELVAEDLRYAQEALTEITGTFSSDDLLGKIFSTFCIGK